MNHQQTQNDSPSFTDTVSSTLEITETTTETLTQGNHENMDENETGYITLLNHQDQYNKKTLTNEDLLDGQSTNIYTSTDSDDTCPGSTLESCIDVCIPL